MQVKLYKFEKKDNSTKRPSGGTTHDNVYLKDTTSVTSPVIVFHSVPIVSPINYNYAYIESFSRYYFITDWTFNNGLWEASMKEDVLASFKTEIGSSRLYIMRSASAYNAWVVDDLYPTKYYVTTDEESAPSSISAGIIGGSASTTIQQAFGRPRASGFYYVKIVSYSGNGLQLYVFNSAGFSQLVKSIANIDYDDFPESEEGVARTLANPIQYITNVYWLPYLLPNITLNAIDLTLGYYTVSISTGGALLTPTAFYCTFDIAIPVHPQSSRGWYVNQEPYTSYTLKFQPFGNYKISTGSLARSTAITLTWNIDVWTGKAILEGRAKQTNALILTDTCDYGVPIELAQITTSISNSLGRGALSTYDKGRSKMNLPSWYGDPLGISLARLFTESQIGSAITGEENAISKIGSAGSFLPFLITPTLCATFYHLTDEDLTHAGRPLCEERLISSLSGYVQCRDGDINIDCYADERTQIANYLTGGFFYE